MNLNFRNLKFGAGSPPPQPAGIPNSAPQQQPPVAPSQPRPAFQGLKAKAQPAGDSFGPRFGGCCG